MFEPGRFRSAMIALALVLAAVAAVSPSWAAEAPASTGVPALPDTLTRESVRDLLSQLTDEQARKLLLDQLDRASAPAAAERAASAAATVGGMGRMSGVVDQHAEEMRGRYGTLVDALRALPATLRDVAARVAGPGDAATRLAGYLLLFLGGGALAEIACDYALRRYRARLAEAPAAGAFTRALARGIGLLFDLCGLAIFGAVALVLFFALWLGDELRRITVLEIIFGVVLVRFAALIAGFLLAPNASQRRLLPFADGAARSLHRFAIAMAVVFGLASATISVLGAGGASAEILQLAAMGFVTVGLAIVLATVWRVRTPIATLIRGDGRGAVAGWLADLWPVIATACVLVLFSADVFNLLAGTAGVTGAGIASLLLIVALPIVDMALCRAVRAAIAERPATTAVGARGWLAVYEPTFRRAIHIVVVVAGLMLLARVWRFDLFAAAQMGFGARIAGALLDIGIVLLVAYLLWEIARTAIDRRLAAEGARDEDVPATRLRTVLPIVRATILVGIAVIATMFVLTAVGVNILPLLAGAGVVGVAIGFGSQTLVRDIVSGAFFLMDDAFRLGEYIEVGDAKGRVEKINLRSMFLRHHRGALNILPYGEIKRLRNTSRDWSIHVLEFRLTYDTSMLQVKKLIKQIGDELAADPDYAADILQPLKSAGVMAAEDSAIVVRAKFTARPGNTAWVVRRVAYDKIIRAFRAAGIRFAHRQVTVNVPASADADVAERSAAAAAAVIESQVARAADKSPQP